MNLLDPELRPVLERAAELIDAAQRAQAAAEHLGAQTEQLRSALHEKQRELDSVEGELAFWRTRATAMAKALSLWRQYDRAQKHPAADAPARGTRVYVEALQATREAMADFDLQLLH